MVYLTKRLVLNDPQDNIGVIFKVSTQEAVDRLNDKYFVADMKNAPSTPVLVGKVRKNGARDMYAPKKRPFTCATAAGAKRHAHRNKAGDSYDATTNTYTFDYTLDNAFGYEVASVDPALQKDIPGLTVHAQMAAETLNNSNNYVTALAETLTVLKHTGLKVSNMVIDGDKTIINVA